MGLVKKIYEFLFTFTGTKNGIYYEHNVPFTGTKIELTGRKQNTIHDPTCFVREYIERKYENGLIIGSKAHWEYFKK